MKRGMAYRRTIIFLALAFVLVVPLSSIADVAPPPEIIDVQQFEQTACIITCVNVTYNDQNENVFLERTSAEKDVTIFDGVLPLKDSVGEAGNWNFSVFILPDLCVPPGQTIYKLQFGDPPFDYLNTAGFSIKLTDSGFNCETQSSGLCQHINLPDLSRYCYQAPTQYYDDTVDDDGSADSGKKSCGGCSTAEDSGVSSLALAVGLFIAGLFLAKITGKRKR